jgi:peptide deformylase
VSILDIRVLGDPILREETKEVGEITDEIRQLVKNMFDTMYLAKGIGLAAPQVGRPERLAVIDVNEKPFVIINPEIVEADAKKDKAEEGVYRFPTSMGTSNGRRACVCARSISRASHSRSKRRSCSGAAYSTRSIICTASCSSIT